MAPAVTEILFKALEKFYAKHEPQKPEKEVIEVWTWAQQKVRDDWAFSRQTKAKTTRARS